MFTFWFALIEKRSLLLHDDNHGDERHYCYFIDKPALIFYGSGHLSSLRLIWFLYLILDFLNTSLWPLSFYFLLLNFSFFAIMSPPLYPSFSLSLLLLILSLFYLFPSVSSSVKGLCWLWYLHFSTGKGPVHDETNHVVVNLSHNIDLILLVFYKDRNNINVSLCLLYLSSLPSVLTA